MQVSFQVNLPAAAEHLKKDQYGAIVAYAMGLRGFNSVRVWKTLMEVTLNIGDFDGKADVPVSDLRAEITSQILALWEIDPIFCPCGCMTPIALQNCIRVDGSMLQDGLTSEEIFMVEHGSVTEAAKKVRTRTGMVLKSALTYVQNWQKRNLPVNSGA